MSQVNRQYPIEVQAYPERGSHPAGEGYRYYPPGIYWGTIKLEPAEFTRKELDALEDRMQTHWCRHWDWVYITSSPPMKWIDIDLG